MTINFPQTTTTAKLSPCVKGMKGGYHQDDPKYAGAGKEKKELGPIKVWLYNIRENMKEYNMSEEMIENGSVWHMKTTGRPFTRRHRREGGWDTCCRSPRENSAAH